MIHIFRKGESIASIAERYGVSAARLRSDNGIPAPLQPVDGQALLVLIPDRIYRVESGDTVGSVARRFGITQKQLVRRNPYLLTSPLLAGEYITISYRDFEPYSGDIFGYAYPGTNIDVLRFALLYIDRLFVFSYGFTSEGALVQPNDARLLGEAERFSVAPVLVLTPSDDLNAFSNTLINGIVNDTQAQERLINELIPVMLEKGFTGIDMDFEYITRENRDLYTAFVEKVARAMRENGFTTNVCLAPKTSSEQKGLLYEGIDYAALGSAADSVLLMTYEWGYTYGPPMAVAPLPQVEGVLRYGLSEIPASKIYLGVPNYGYDWPLPYIKGESKARTVGNAQAVSIAREVGASIEFDETARSPYFLYPSHEVWFEDVRSLSEKLDLASRNDLRGIGIWNLLRPLF